MSEHGTSARVIALDDHRAGRDHRRGRCAALTAYGRACRNHAGPSCYCRVHEPDPVETAPRSGPRRGPERVEVAADRWSLLPFGDAAGADDALAKALEFIRRRATGAYDVDVFGFDRELTEQVCLPLARPLYYHWWRVATVGIENVPRQGHGALVVSNHAGTLPFDAIMTQVALHDEHPDNRHLRGLAADLALRLPVVGPLTRKTGGTLAHDADAEALLRRDEVVGVWPEGFKGVGKRFWDRYKLQRFGRGGFVQVALRTGRPIVPVAVIGSEEIFPMIGNVAVLARLFGLPYFPVTWTFPWLGPLGMVPLPSKWLIEFGEPIDPAAFGPEAGDDPGLVFELTDRVRDTIQQMLHRNLMGRRSVFF